MRVVLRDVTESDLPVLFEHQIDPVAHRMAVFTPRKRKAFMAHWAKILADPSAVARTIECDGEIAGHIGIFEQSGRRLVGYWIGRSHWNRGIATAALRALLDEEPHRPLFAYVVKDNLGSIRVLEKCGFRQCGEHREGSIVELEMQLS